MGEHQPTAPLTGTLAPAEIHGEVTMNERGGKPSKGTKKDGRKKGRGRKPGPKKRK